MDYKMKIVSFCFIFLHSSITLNCLECPVCMHIGYKFTHMPSYVEDLMVSLMGSYKNPACKANTVKPTECDVGGFGSVSKCVSVVVTVNTKGMTTVNPEAGMEIEVVTRGCTSRPRSEADTCKHISSVLDADTQAQLMQSIIKGIKQRFLSVSYNGQICYNSQNTKASSTSSANIVNVCKVAYYVLTLFLLRTFC